jgi:hypothetical protein
VRKSREEQARVTGDGKNDDRKEVAGSGLETSGKA